MGCLSLSDSVFLQGPEVVEAAQEQLSICSITSSGSEMPPDQKASQIRSIWSRTSPEHSQFLRLIGAAPAMCTGKQGSRGTDREYRLIADLLPRLTSPL